jgi:hypothetical protein
MQAMSTASSSLTLTYGPARADRGELVVNLLLIAVIAVLLFDAYSLLIALR